jgi:hypothetical protein
LLLPAFIASASRQVRSPWISPSAPSITAPAPQATRTPPRLKKTHSIEWSLDDVVVDDQRIRPRRTATHSLVISYVSRNHQRTPLLGVLELDFRPEIDIGKRFAW